PRVSAVQAGHPAAKPHRRAHPARDRSAPFRDPHPGSVVTWSQSKDKKHKFQARIAPHAEPHHGASIMTSTLLSLYLLITAGASGTPQPGGVAEAFYIQSPAGEGENPPVSRLRLTVTGTQEVDGRPMVWWEFAALPRDGGQPFGIRVLSERHPMSGPDGVG